MPGHGAILLCGGHSSRMGRAKAWLPWRGQPLAAHLAAVLSEAADEVVVVTSRSLDPPPLPRSVRVVRDEHEDRGPLAGLAAGLDAIAADRAFVTGTDVPFLTPAFVRAVLAAADADRPAAPVVDGFAQPLGAAWPKRCAARAVALLAGGRRGPLDLLEALGHHPLPAESLPDPASLRGVDTPSEYLAAIADDGQTTPAVLELGGRARELARFTRLEVPIGTLASVLSHAPGRLPLYRGDHVAPAFRVSLGGRELVRDTRVPVGPGERVIVLDADA